jgi:hypothetical protein
MRTMPLLALLLAACASPYSTHEAASIHTPVNYSCDDGMMTWRLRASPGGTHVTLPSGEEVFLPQQNADGSAARMQQESKGSADAGTWQAGSRVPSACRVQR